MKQHKWATEAEVQTGGMEYPMETGGVCINCGRFADTTEPCDDADEAKEGAR